MNATKHTPLLDIQQLNVTYRSSRPAVPALRDVSLSLTAGESLGIIGESGCGKTTLALSIVRLIREAQITGRIILEGQELNAMGENALRRIRWRKVAMVFQNALEVFNPVITLGEQIGEPLRTHFKLSRKEIDARVAELFSLTGLDPAWRHQYPHHLSGGMRQRALIAMALSCNPDVLIVDEPFSAFDAESRHAMVHLIEALKERVGFAMILISHNLVAIQQLTTKMFTLYAGHVVEQGRTGDVLRNPMHPYTRGLINSAPEFFQYKDLWGIAGDPPVSGENKGCPFAPRCVQKDDECASSIPKLCRISIERMIACHKGGIENLLTARGIQKSFQLGDHRITALDNVDIRIRRGEVAALVGSSGSGKSTLAHILVNVLAADSGDVQFAGRPVVEKNATACMGGMQIVFQDPAEAVSHRLKVLEAVREPLDIMAWKDRESRDRKSIEVMATMHLPVTKDFLNRSCHTLSGGQRQRLAIARAMVTDPILLVADEITAMLDPSTQATLLRELKGLQHGRGFSMLFITHDIHLARKVADRVYVLENGCIVEHGAAFEVFDHPRTGHTHRLLDAAFDHERSIGLLNKKNKK
jgi:peptide/nickel transport system ATP-binding protein